MFPRTSGDEPIAPPSPARRRSRQRPKICARRLSVVAGWQGQGERGTGRGQCAESQIPAHVRLNACQGLLIYLCERSKFQEPLQLASRSAHCRAVGVSAKCRAIDRGSTDVWRPNAWRWRARPPTPRFARISLIWRSDGSTSMNSPNMIPKINICGAAPSKLRSAKDLGAFMGSHIPCHLIFSRF
jgi:hypothetical protein